MAIGQQPPSAPGRSGWSRPLFTPDPNAGPDPFEHSYPPWLTTGIVGAITGAIIGGLVVFTVVGNSAVQPIPVAPPTVVVPSSGPIAVATPGVLGQALQGLAENGLDLGLPRGQVGLPLGDLGQHIEVEFVARLRNEERFATLAALTAQMHCDAAAARRILNA